MTAKEYLNQYKILNDIINDKLENQRQLMEIATSISPASGFGVHGSSQPSDKVGKNVARIADLEQEINDDIDKLLNMREQIAETVSRIPDERYRRILTQRYIGLKKWNTIAEENHLDLRWVYRLHKNALEQLTTTLPNNNE